MKRFLLLNAIAVVLTASLAAGQENEAVFSGPQVGEKLTAFKVRGAYDEQAGKSLDLVSDAEGRPLVLVFLHELTRPSAAVTRTVMSYVKSREKDGIRGAVVFLSEDVTAAEEVLKRSRHALVDFVPVGISTDGLEGPGSYGLNRNVSLTVLVAKENKVTANFALVQPSVAADVPKILGEVVKLIGGEVPSTEAIEGMQAPRGAERGRMKAKQAAGAEVPDANLRRLLAPLIRKDADDQSVGKSAAAVEAYAAENEDARDQIGSIADRIVKANRLSNYGSPAAQRYIRKWAEEWGPK